MEIVPSDVARRCTRHKLSDYVKIKDKYCICYFGDITDTVQKSLNDKIKELKEEFPNLTISICCRDDHCKYMKDSIPKSKLNKDNFLLVEEIPAIPTHIEMFWQKNYQNKIKSP